MQEEDRKTAFDLKSQTSLSVAGCGQLQLEVADWVTSVALLQVVDN